MRSASARPLFLSGAAVCGAVLWGLTEFFALQWSWLSGQRRARS